MKSKAVQFLEAHQSGEQSTFVADAQWRQENASWLKRSRRVALAIIDFMQENKLSRNDIAKRLGVSPQYVSKITLRQGEFFIQDNRRNRRTFRC